MQFDAVVRVSNRGSANGFLTSISVSALSTFVLPIIILVVVSRWGVSLWSAVGALVFCCLRSPPRRGTARAGLSLRSPTCRVQTGCCTLIYAALRGRGV